MNVVDSSGWIEYFRDGPNADVFAGPIGDTAQLLVPSISIYEVAKVLLRERGRADMLAGVAQMRQAVVIDLGDSLATEAARVSLEQGLAMADSVILATAQAYHAELWTQDEDFAGIAGVQYYAKVT